MREEEVAPPSFPTSDPVLCLQNRKNKIPDLLTSLQGTTTCLIQAIDISYYSLPSDLYAADEMFFLKMR